MSLTDSTPYYHQVADTLRRRIREGDYPVGSLLPPSSALERTFQVSNNTVRKAMALLVQEGLVRGQRGIGTVVLGQPEDRRVPIRITGNFSEWLASADAGGFDIGQEVLDIGLSEAPRRVYRRLNRLPVTHLWRMRRLRRRDGEAISLHINYGSPDRLSPITAEAMAEDRSFVACYRRLCRPAMARMDQTVEAVVADVDLAELLETSFNAPLLFQENTWLAADGTPLAVSHLYFRADRYAYEASIDLAAPPAKERPRQKK